MGKPNAANLESKLADEDADSASEDDGEMEKSNVYKPPKISAVHYDGDETQKERQERLVERKKKKALSSSIMRDLRAEYYQDGPEEIKDDTNMHRAKFDKKEKEREEYEEKYFLRMQVSKKEMNASKRLRTMGDLNNITNMGGFSALTGEEE